jgi:hypothetical protein
MDANFGSWRGSNISAILDPAISLEPFLNGRGTTYFIRINTNQSGGDPN